MPWRTIHARSSAEPKPKGRLPTGASPGAMRLCGALGFVGSAYVTVRVGAYLFGRPPGFLNASEWSATEVIIFAVTILAAVFGCLVGAGLGLSMNVRNAHVNRFLLIVWHFLANGQIAALLILTAALQRSARVASASETIDAFGLTALATAAAGVVLFAFGQFDERRGSNLLLCACVTTPMGAVVSRQYARIFSIESSRALVVGLAFGFVVLFASAYMIRRDYDQMAESRRLFGHGT